MASSSSADIQLQPKRPPAPAPMARQSSQSSHMSQSLSDGPHQKSSAHKGQRQHVVGQSRVQRNASQGKNLNKLNKLNNLAQAHGGDGNASKQHRRTPSGGTSNSAPSSPRPGFKRNASHAGVVRASHAPHAHVQTALRKNHSSGHLARQGNAKAALKSSKSEVAPPKRSLVQSGKARAQSPEAHPSVHFDVGDDEDDDEQDDGWTEASASQSPTTTRSNTRSNSVILEPQKANEATAEQDAAEEAPQYTGNNHQPHPREPPAPYVYALPDRTRHPGQVNGGGSHRHSRPPDADMITSRLLRRSSTNNAPPQMSAVEATVVTDAQDSPRLLNHSTTSTFVDTPGRDLVSRFMDGDGSAGMSGGSSFLPSHNSPQGAGGELNMSKRNRSMPNVANAGTPTRTPRRSGTSTPTDLPPSRTQQKLMLQRASSNIEPNKLLPTILPRTGGPVYLQPGMGFPMSGEGRMDPRLKHQFEHVAAEYKVARRFRDPISDSTARIQQVPGVPAKCRVPKAARPNGAAHKHGSSSTSTSFTDSRAPSRVPSRAPSRAASIGSAGRRGRVSFENDGSREDRDTEGSQSDTEEDEDEDERTEKEIMRDDAEEICRRIWERAVEGD